MLYKGDQVLFYIKSEPLKSSELERDIQMCFRKITLAVVGGNFKAI